MANNVRTTADRILRARLKAGMTIAEVARQANVPTGTLWNWEAGRCVPAPKAPGLVRVADVLALPKVAVANPA